MIRAARFVGLVVGIPIEVPGGMPPARWGLTTATPGKRRMTGPIPWPGRVP